MATSNFISLLEEVVSSDSILSWENLLAFASGHLYYPKRGGKKCFLATQVNRQLNLAPGLPVSPVITRSSGGIDSLLLLLPQAIVT